VTHKPSKLERQLVTVEGRLSYLLDYALSQGLPQLRQALAILAEPCLSGDRRRWALRDIRLGVSALHSLCRAHRKGRLTAAHHERYGKVLRRLRPLRNRVELAGVPIPPAVVRELEKHPGSPGRQGGPRLYVLESLLRFLRRWLGWPEERLPAR
jgi:hypothetical protein